MQEDAAGSLFRQDSQLAHLVQEQEALTVRLPCLRPPLDWGTHSWMPAQVPCWIVITWLSASEPWEFQS